MHPFLLGDIMRLAAAALIVMLITATAFAEKRYKCEDPGVVDITLYTKEKPLTQADIDGFIKGAASYPYFVRYWEDGLDRKAVAAGVEKESGMSFVRYCYTTAKIVFTDNHSRSDWPVYMLSAEGISSISEAEKALINKNNTAIEKAISEMGTY